MNKNRCGWCVGDKQYETYHDEEWGVPVYDDDKLFEFLVLETFQVGLSWIGVLRKRENFRKAFDGFDYQKIAQYSEAKVQELLQNEGIIRNKLKIRATITNAQTYLDVQKDFGSFRDYSWNFVGGKPLVNTVNDYKKAPASTEISQQFSKDLKNRGFKFVGPTVVYAHMQATGMVNDHEVSCFRYQEIIENY